MDLSVLTRHEWRRIWLELPPLSRGVFSNPDYHDVCANWVSAEPECLLLREGDRSVTYSYLRCPIDESLTGNRNLFDVQTCYGYGGPIFCGGWTASERRHALRTIGNYLRDTSVVAEFIRCRTERIDLDDFLGANYEVRRVRTNVEWSLALGDSNEIPPTWRRSARRNISQGRRRGLVHTLGSSTEDIAEFDRLYQITAERRSMEPFYRFNTAQFASLLALDPQRVKLILVRHSDKGTCIAGGILLVDGTSAYHHLGASDPAFLALCPNDYLMFALAGIAASHPVHRIVWGGGRSNDPQDTLFKFKSRFGDRFAPVHIACRVIDAATYERLCARWEARNPEGRTSTRLFLRYRQ
jgi:serine/alanine adding enzyme